MGAVHRLPHGGRLEAIDRHVVSASLLDARFQVITPEPGTHVALAAPRNHHWVHAWSTADSPAAPRCG